MHMHDLCDITIHSEPGSVTEKGKQSGNGNEIHPQVIFHLRTLFDLRANLFKQLQSPRSVIN